MPTIEDLRDQLSGTLKAMLPLATKGQIHLSEDERKHFAELNAAADWQRDQLREAQNEAVKASKAADDGQWPAWSLTAEYLSRGLGARGSFRSDCVSGLKWRDGKSMGEHLLRDQTGGSGIGYKALAPSGAIVTPLPAPEVIAEGQPVLRLRQLIPERPATPAFSYLRQTVRNPNAAPVAVGAQKPLSDFQTELISGKAEVVATLSNPTDRFLLQDATNLRDFLNSELAYAIELAIEQALLNGAAGSLIVGFLATTGIGAQPFADDVLTTVATAISNLAAAGTPATAIVMNSTDWLATTLTKDANGRFIVGSGAPVDATTQRLWGLPVVLSPELAPGTALVGDFANSACVFVADGGQVRTDWSENVGTNFATNQVTFRSETRLNLGVLRPAGFTVATLSDVAPTSRSKASS